MRKYSVEIHINPRVEWSIEVEADNKIEAKRIALDTARETDIDELVEIVAGEIHRVGGETR